MLFANFRVLMTLFSVISPEKQEELCNANSRYFKGSDPADVLVSGGPDLDEHLSAKAKYISTDTWPRSRRGRELKKRAARPYMHGVEIRRLEVPHPLSGQVGLFAARNFLQFDILGEYCGEVFDTEGGGEYATYLEDKSNKYALGVDAASEGNECRCINHYTGIAEGPNVIMKIAYVEELPRVMVVCTRDINVGEEFLFKYSDEYVQEYLV